MLKKIKLDIVFTFILTLLMIASIIISGMALATTLYQKTETEIASKALMLMKNTDAVWNYTALEVSPELEQRLETEFLPEIVPFYSANEVFEKFRENPEYQEYLYREALLNPTNIRDLAKGYEVEIAKKFIKDKQLKELTGFEVMDGIRFFYLARPRVVNFPSCLKCHATPEAAPDTMVAQYGTENGFGWNLNEVLGAQIISIPVTTVFNSAYKDFVYFTGFVLLALIIPLLAVKILLSWLIVEPLNYMREVALKISHGKTEKKFEEKGKNEVGALAKALNRMKRSFEEDRGTDNYVNEGEGENEGEDKGLKKT